MIIKKKKTKKIEQEVQEQSIASEVLDLPQSTLNPTVPDEKEIDLFDLDNIDFKQRQERRRGDRRRGFRRIDDRNLISRAREEAKAIKEAAAKEGYEEGLRTAQMEIEDLRNSITSFMNAKQEVFDSIAPDILNISFEIAKKIIKKDSVENPEIIIENIKEIMSDLSKEETKITIKASPSQVPILKQELPSEAKNLGLDANIIVVSDDNIMEGGCVLTTSNGVIDATIESQLSIISEVLKGI